MSTVVINQVTSGVIFSWASIETDSFLQPEESPSTGHYREYRLCIAFTFHFYIQCMGMSKES